MNNNTRNKSFSHHTFANTVRIAAIAAACVTMSALTLPKPPIAPPTEITLNIDSTDTTESSDSSDSAQSNLVSTCVGDLNLDHAVDAADLGTLLGQFGACAGSCSADLNFDSKVDGSDLGTLLVQYGQCPSNLAWATVLQWNPDSAVVPEATVRANIVASGYPWRVLDTGTGIEMLFIPAGTFTMGCSASNSYGCYAAENPTHRVTLSKGFYLGKTEVTQAQWQAKMGNNPSYFKGYSDSASRPVEQVSWADITGFNTATGLRLPNEAEWEYACRGGTTTAFHSTPSYPNGTNDDNQLGIIAWYSSNAGSTTHAVGGKAANAFGLFDMSGNVIEWCKDWSSNSYSAGDVTDPTGPSTGTVRTARGGSGSPTGSSDTCRTSVRFWGDPVARSNGVGFRVARHP